MTASTETTGPQAAPGGTVDAVETVEERPRLVVIIGSTRPDRFGPTPASWFAREAEKHAGFDVDLVDLAGFDLPPGLGGNDPDAALPEDVAALGRRLVRADAFVVVTPTYNRSYASVLKTAIDWFYSEWSLKPVGFVAYGGHFGAFPPIEHLRGVFVEFNAVPLRDAVVLQRFWERFDHDGRAVDAERMGRWAHKMLDQLTWWALSLKESRARREYPAGIAE
ncbi:NADPH-dependent FMN reductase [Nesterenkonia xinjiangensis]|uniref:NAD(P)H-dependent FMN reductase n=1 Tax=Nesterenkonia xinjiangensis TaxID=225327 RepID=A0A7Z0K9D2_9MICC|nr:NAD(P)H-dependent oxidoreductase [Nesterenkonia xinjiangensis]NYJ77688.1 NAD(P)H-dependent FMN reductase [Nesterenkonia xinjiangensis]